MTESTVVYTDLSDSKAAGDFLAAKILEGLGSHSPDALIVFAASRHDYSKLLRAIKAGCRPKVMVGCSSAGEFTQDQQGESSASVVAIRSAEMQFTAGVGHNLRGDREAAAEEIVSSFKGRDYSKYLFRSALVLTDALAGYADDLIESLTHLTAGTYSLFGGGAGDDAKFTRTHVFYDTEAIPDAAVALEILSNKPLGIGVSHGWVPSSAPMRVTESDGMRLISLNATPAAEVFQEHAAATGQTLELESPVSFFLHNVLGIDTGSGHKLRVPLAVNADGSVTCAADIPIGAIVRIMSATAESSAVAAESAAKSALQQLNGNQPQVALFFDCVATRLRMGKEFGLEMEALKTILGETEYAGCNTYGQIARAGRQFSGFHNCTAVVCVIPE